MTEIAAQLVQPMVITTVDGEQRQARVWDSGIFECPFCLCPTDPHGRWYDDRSWDGPCANPMCIAGGRGDADSVAAFRQAEAALEAERKRRVQLIELDEQARTEREASRQGRVQVFLAQAEETGECYRCWAHSTSHGAYMARPVIIRHRKPENCPQAQRDARRTR
jgi:hypothetical protein